MIKKTCIHCGAEFEAQRNSAKYCSQKCKKAHKRELQKTEKTCPVCGTKFMANKTQKYCTTECSKIARAKKIKQYNAKWNPINNPKNNPKYNDKKRINDNATMTAAKHANPDIQFKRDKNGKIAYAYGTSECEQQLKKYEHKTSKQSDIDAFDKLLDEITRDE